MPLDAHSWASSSSPGAASATKPSSRGQLHRLAGVGERPGVVAHAGSGVGVHRQGVHQWGQCPTGPGVVEQPVSELEELRGQRERPAGHEDGDQVAGVVSQLPLGPQQLDGGAVAGCRHGLVAGDECHEPRDEVVEEPLVEVVTVGQLGQLRCCDRHPVDVVEAEADRDELSEGAHPLLSCAELSAPLQVPGREAEGADGLLHHPEHGMGACEGRVVRSLREHLSGVLLRTARVAAEGYVLGGAGQPRSRLRRVGGEPSGALERRRGGEVAVVAAGVRGEVVEVGSEPVVGADAGGEPVPHLRRRVDGGDTGQGAVRLPPLGR
jgi:hypothetical protein